jgi:hypothetical protein
MNVLRATCRAGLPAVVFAILSVAAAKAFTISQLSSDEVNNVPVTGCVDVKGASTASGTAADDYPCNGNANEQWYFNGTQFIGLGGNCLTTKAGLEVITPCGGSAQDWTITKTSENAAELKQGKRCLTSDVLGGTNQQLELETCTGSAAQLWILQ